MMCENAINTLSKKVRLPNTQVANTQLKHNLRETTTFALTRDAGHVQSRKPHPPTPSPLSGEGETNPLSSPLSTKWRGDGSRAARDGVRLISCSDFARALDARCGPIATPSFRIV